MFYLHWCQKATEGDQVTYNTNSESYISSSLEKVRQIKKINNEIKDNNLITSGLILALIPKTPTAKT